MPLFLHRPCVHKSGTGRVASGRVAGGRVASWAVRSATGMGFANLASAEVISIGVGADAVMIAKPVGGYLGLAPQLPLSLHDPQPELEQPPSLVPHSGPQP